MDNEFCFGQLERLLILGNKYLHLEIHTLGMGDLYYQEDIMSLRHYWPNRFRLAQLLHTGDVFFNTGSIVQSIINPISIPFKIKGKAVNVTQNNDDTSQEVSFKKTRSPCRIILYDNNDTEQDLPPKDYLSWMIETFTRYTTTDMIYDALTQINRDDVLRVTLVTALMYLIQPLWILSVTACSLFLYARAHNNTDSIDFIREMILAYTLLCISGLLGMFHTFINTKDLTMGCSMNDSIMVE